MAELVRLPVPLDDSPAIPTKLLARRLAAAGMGVQISGNRDTCQLAIVGAATGKSFVSLNTSPAVLIGIIAYLLEAPPGTASLAAYRALPLKGQVGRFLQDRGLAVTLRVSEDWESFEATTDIDITSPARPWLGTVTVSDDAALDWCCNTQTAFAGDAAAFIDVITPVLRAHATRGAGR
jgi:hypothetical protein